MRHIFLLLIFLLIALTLNRNSFRSRISARHRSPRRQRSSQNIAPVSKDLGNGRSLTTNLYWGAAYGLKTFLRKSSKFTLIGCKKVNEEILERCEFPT